MDDGGILKEFFSNGGLQGSFAICVACYLLIRVEADIKALRAAVEKFSHCKSCTLSPFTEVSDDN